VAFAEPRPRTVTLVDTFGPVLASGRDLVSLREIVPATPLAAVPRERAEANREALGAFLRACRAGAAGDPGILDVARAYSAIVDRMG
jgi:hypothetical protein